MNDQILVVDDELTVRELLVTQLDFLGFQARATADGEETLAAARSATPPSLVLLDIEMPGLSGVELLRSIKQIDDDIQVVMVSGLSDLATVRECLRSGAYDYLAKPFELEDLNNTIGRALERRRLIRENRDYESNLKRHKVNLEREVAEKTEELRHTRDLALMTLAKLAESRDSETGLHLERMAEYSRILAQAAIDGPYRDEASEEFVDWVFKASPLHDIGKVGIPDDILRKEGPLTEAERDLMRTHTTIGGDTLRSVIADLSASSPLHMAMEIAYSHHERWDGRGYPRGLKGEQIPLPARIVAIADAYDAITSRRPYKEAEDHAEAVRRIQIDAGKHFDAKLVETFLEHEKELEQVRRRFDSQHGRSSLTAPPQDLQPRAVGESA